MSSDMPICAFAPASIGNVSVGFDLLGAALQPIDQTPLGDSVQIAAAPQFSLTVSGRFAQRLPGDADSNIVTRAYRFYHQQAQALGHTLPPAAMTLIKRLPIGSGLGSSASSIVAALYALNQFYAGVFNPAQLLRMMGELEGQISGGIHYDNVAPSHLGGLTLMVEQGDCIATQLPVPEHWLWVVCYSGLSVSTSAARQILPKEYPLKTLLTFGRQLSVFVDALHRGDSDLAASMVHDVVAEPYRQSLLPGFAACRQQATELGALAFGISGSGPTVFALCADLPTASAVEQMLQQQYIQNADGFSHICQIDRQGARLSQE